MSVDYTHDSKFAPERSLVKVRCGSGAKFLSVEANELQDIQNYLRSRLLYMLIPSGVQSKVAYSVSGLADNIMYAGKMEMWLKGFPITVADWDSNENNKVTLPAPSGVRNDLVYLECWFEEIDYTDNLYKYGGENCGLLTNNLLDTDIIEEETSKRVQLRWRILTVADVNFGTHPKGVTDTSKVQARGAQSSPTGLYFTADSKDAGLFVAGTGSSGDKTTLGTVDGYSYALPLFKVARTASATLVLGNVTDLRTESIASSTAFGKVAVSGQSDVVADSIMDILTLIAGNNITLTTNATNDSVTISVNNHASQHVTGGADVVADAVANGNSGLLSGYEKALLAQMFAKWEAKDITGAVGSNTTDATAFSGTARTCSAAGVMVNGSSAGKSLRFLPYIAIFRIKASTTGTSSLTLKIKRSGGTDLVSRTVTATEVGTSWAYFKLPFVFETAGETVYPEITYGTTGATFSVDSIVVSPDTAVLA